MSIGLAQVEKVRKMLTFTVVLERQLRYTFWQRKHLMLLICCIPAEIFLDIRHLVRQACDNSREKEDTSSSSFFDLLKVEKCQPEDIRTLAKAVLIAYKCFLFRIETSLHIAKHLSRQKKGVLKIYRFLQIFPWCDL